MKIIKSIFAADIDLGGITGVGKFQDAATVTNPKESFGILISSLISTITIIGGLAFLIYFIVGGLKWITSGGDKGKVSEAQTQMTQAAVGLIVIVVSYFLTGIVGSVLGLNILNPFKVLFP